MTLAGFTIYCSNFTTLETMKLREKAKIVKMRKYRNNTWVREFKAAMRNIV